jgi:ABC-2 type transport system ATP-binding protein
VWSAIDRRREQRNVTVVVVTHNVVEAESFLDTVAVLDSGRVVACDTPGRLKAMVSDDVRLDVVWRFDPPSDDPAVRALEAASEVTGRRWSARLSQSEARALLGKLTTGPAFEALDDFTLATPSLEDVYLALGGRARDMERV